ncbi:MAG TPA: helix-turn-helix transcriptional regulator [Mucilaginibacter sp.]|nr:helix-turn-helix transcriptional regulator [Mucilaginibacter sp.]
MNKILYVARKAKGFKEAQLAKVLQMDETAYKEMECSLSNVSAQHALKLGNLFNVEPEYFLANESRGPALINTFMEGVTTILKDKSTEPIPPGIYAIIINLCNKGLLLQVELNSALFKQHELEKDNEAIRELYTKLKEQIHETA